MKKNPSGIISYSNGIIKYQQSDFSWSINLSDVHIIGEYTTSEGPYLDDYFFVFLTAKEKGWHEASFYADGREDFLKDLSNALSCPVVLGLCNSANFRTRIIWPLHLSGKPFMEIMPKPTWFGRLIAKLSGNYNIRMTDEAKNILPD